ncbi:Regulatory protein RecX [termite gut metagenome]|uniref:Regulatory protein RecX n=1 Tax=termite gut metagenome TaxID=433724 RepID=A0A5J4PZV9_9ZZZZ
MTENEALNRMMSYCSGAEHCSSEIRGKLLNWEFEADVIEGILNHLEKEKFIDNERYARSFVNDKFHFAKWGKVKIKQALYVKQIPPEVISQGLREIDEEEYLGVLQGLLERKKETIHAKDEYEQKGKLVRYALGKGFEIWDIEKCMERG